MVTKYNLEIIVKPTPMPQGILEGSLAQVASEGLYGRKHIDNIGRLFEGYDTSCDKYRRGEFQLFYRQDEETASEILQRLRLTVDGDNNLQMRVLEMAEFIVPILEHADPVCRVMSWADYCQTSLIRSMELDLVCGKQSVHFHHGEMGLIRLWKARKQNQWYDYDMLSDYLFDIMLEGWGETDRLHSSEDSPGFIERIKLGMKSRGLKKFERLWDQLKRNPDSIRKIPRFVDN